MSFHAKEFAARTALTYDTPSATFCGIQNGYAVFVRHQARQGTMLFVLYGKADEGRDLSAELEQWRFGRTGISALNYAKNCLSCMVSIPAKNALEETVSNFEALMELARTLELVPCCMACGTTFGYSPYLLDGTGVSLCSACRDATQQRIGEVREERQAERSNPAGTVVSIVIGAALVAGLTYLVLRLGYVSYLVGYAGVLVMFLLMQKLGKKITLPAAIIGTVICMVIAFATPVYSFAKDFAAFNTEKAATAQQFCDSYEELDQLSEEEKQALSEQEELQLDFTQIKKQYETCRLMLSHQDTASCFRDMTKLLKTDTFSSAKSQLLKCILGGVLSILIGALLTLPRMLHESSGRHELREIPV